MLACQSKIIVNTGNSRHKRTSMKLVQNNMKEFFLYHSPGLNISSLHTDSMITITNKSQLERKRKLFQQRTNATLQSATMLRPICLIKQHSFQTNQIRQQQFYPTIIMIILSEKILQRIKEHQNRMVKIMLINLCCRVDFQKVSAPYQAQTRGKILIPK